MVKGGEPGAAVTAAPMGGTFTADGATGATGGKKERRKRKPKSKGDRLPKGGHRAATHKGGKGGKGPSGRDGKEAVENASGTGKLSKYWCKFGSDGNAFLRTCLGGVGNDQKSGKGWEFADAAEAIGKGRFKTVQQLYDRMAEDTAVGIPPRPILPSAARLVHRCAVRIVVVGHPPIVPLPPPSFMTASPRIPR